MKSRNFYQNCVYAINKPRKIMTYLLKNYGYFLPDKFYISLMFHLCLGYRLDLNNPKTFNEKIQWLKLYDRRPEYTTYVDKYAVREYLSKTIGEKYLIPLLGVWDRPEEIDFDKLPEQFVLKCNHNSGSGMCICKNKSELNLDVVRKNLLNGLSEDYYLYNREWAYKNVPKKIIAEEYMVDESRFELKDYKVMCFNGKAKYIRVCFNRNTDLKINWYDLDWNFCDIRMVEPPDRNVRHPKPECLHEMIELSERLAKNIPFVRIDWYIVNKKLYSGEITLYPDGGFGDTEPMEYDKILGNFISLPI